MAAWHSRDQGYNPAPEQPLTIFTEANSTLTHPVGASRVKTASAETSHWVRRARAVSLAAAAAVVLIGNAVAGERGADLRVGGSGAAVFVGPDSAMPIGSTFEISITPTTSARGAVLRPKDVRGAIVELRKALPHWYQRALMASKGDRQCSVVLPRGDGQDVAYGALIDDWWWDNWGLAKPGNPLRRSFAAFGIRKEDAVRNALSVAVCTYIKSGDLHAAVAEVRKYDERPGKG